MAQASKREVAITEETRLPDAIPDFMKEDIGSRQGTENFGAEDMETPRLKLIQALSPELQEYSDLRAGNYLNTVTGEIHKTLRVTPIYSDRSYILWNPRDAGGGILARAQDGVHWSPPNAEFRVRLDKNQGGAEVVWRTADTVQRSGLHDWGTMNPNDPNSPPAATLMFNFLLAMTDRPDDLPAVLTCQRSSIKVGKHFVTQIRTTGVPSYALVFELSSAVSRNSRNQEFWVPVLRGVGKVQDEATYRRFKGMYAAMSKTGLDLDKVKGLGDEDQAAPTADPEGAPAY